MLTSLPLEFKIHPISPCHSPRPSSLFWQCPQVQFRGSCQPETPNCAPAGVAISFFTGPWLLPLSCVPLWRPPLGITEPRSLSGSFIAQRFLFSGKQRLALCSDSPKHFPVLCDVIATYAPAVFAHLIRTNSVTGDNGWVPPCPPEEQIGIQQGLPSDNALTHKWLKWWDPKLPPRWAFQHWIGELPPPTLCGARSKLNIYVGQTFFYSLSHFTNENCSSFCV